MRIVLALVGFCLIVSAGYSATIRVPGNYGKIQLAIDAAAGGDTILVDPGTYRESIDFLGKAIHLKSDGGAALTVIDGSQAGSVVSFRSGETMTSVLEGFTIRNGDASDGGGIYCYFSAPTIRGNIIKANETYRGGGIYCEEAANFLVEGNTISDNEANGTYYYNGMGGGLYVIKSTGAITNNVLTGNFAGTKGAGLYSEYSTLDISRNTIDGNRAWSSSNGHGGGICFRHYTSSTVSHNVITNNVAQSGGGICCTEDASPLIAHNVISCNTVNGYGGGGIECSDLTSPVITNNMITCNEAAGYSGGGGLICRYQASVIIRNVTFAENSTTEEGGAIFCDSGSACNVVNTIFWNDSAPVGQEICIGDQNNPSSVIISHSDLGGGYQSVHVEPGCNFSWGSGMMNADPLFFDPAWGDFHITWPSPCRWAGDTTVVTETTDFEGDPRIVLGRVDIGADAFHPHLYHFGCGLPGAPIEFKIAGVPGMPVKLALGTSVRSSPLTVAYGDLWLGFPLAGTWQLGAVPPSGILSITRNTPPSWIPGSEHPFQALVGPPGGATTVLTNLLVLEVK